MLTIAAFRHLAAAYGADLARWPAARRSEAETLLVRSPEAQAWLRHEARLDTALAEMTLTEPDETDLARLRARVAAGLLTPPQRRNRLPALPRWGWLAAGASSALAAGLLVGLLSTTPPTTHASLLSMLQPPAVPVLAD